MKYTNLVQSVPTLFDVFATIHFGRLFQAPQEPKKGQVPINSMPTDPKHPTSKKLQKRPHNVPSSDIQKSLLGTRPLEWCRTVAFVTTSPAHPETITVGPDHGCLLVSHGLGHGNIRPKTCFLVRFVIAYRLIPMSLHGEICIYSCTSFTKVY